MAAKNKGQDKTAAFEPAWLDAQTERALALVDEAGERAADLVEAWVAHRNAAAVAEVAAFDQAPAAARKAARRGLNVLKSRGVAIPERTRVARPMQVDAPVVEAWFRPPDSAGSSAFTLGARSPHGRYRLVDVIIKSGAGLLSIADMEMSRTQLRESFGEIGKRFGSPPAPVPIAWARARIAAALLENAQSGTLVPLSFERHADLLGPAPVVSPIHPADEAKLARAERERALAASGTLHAEPELRGWLPEPPAMQKMLMAVQAKIPRETEAADAEALVREVIEAATDEYFTPERRERLAERMKDAAISVVARGARDRAADLLESADVIRKLEPGREPHSIPFLQAFFEKAFGLAAARAARQPPPR
ncbi:MAG TPA: hypothetical protein VF881_05790 [Polyangiaceae bacterium]